MRVGIGGAIGAGAGAALPGDGRTRAKRGFEGALIGAGFGAGVHFRSGLKQLSKYVAGRMSFGTAKAVEEVETAQANAAASAAANAGATSGPGVDVADVLRRRGSNGTAAAAEQVKAAQRPVEEAPGGKMAGGVENKVAETLEARGAGGTQGAVEESLGQTSSAPVESAGKAAGARRTFPLTWGRYQRPSQALESTNLRSYLADLFGLPSEARELVEALNAWELSDGPLGDPLYSDAYTMYVLQNSMLKKNQLTNVELDWVAEHLYGLGDVSKPESTLRAVDPRVRKQMEDAVARSRTRLRSLFESNYSLKPIDVVPKETVYDPKLHMLDPEEQYAYRRTRDKSLDQRVAFVHRHGFVNTQTGEAYRRARVRIYQYEPDRWVEQLEAARRKT